jgi:Ran GTPase-activating protein (RanGAP) involved in mRNA processing and transport
LILDNNDIGRVGADALGRILSESRQLKLLSLENCRLAGNDIECFSKALATNKVLKVLNLGCNRLGDLGMDHLCDALCDNTSLEHLDLFDCHFTNLGGTYL